MCICIICEVSQEDSQFPNYGPICLDCISCLVKLYGVEYAPPKRQSQVEAYLALLLAIRKQAESDGELQMFEKNWLYCSPWNQIIGSVRDVVDISEAVSNELQLLVSQIEGIMV